MIRFENLTKSFWVRGERKIVIDNLNLTLPTGKSLALLGRNGAGKSTLLQIIAGTMRPDDGRVVSDGSISWPVAFGGSFHPDLTGAQNVRFVARIYGVDTDSLVAFVEEFAELGKHFQMPVRTYSQGMRSRLTFGTSMGIRFDTYLVDEVTAVGDAIFRQKSNQVFRARMKTASAILVSHNMQDVRAFCDAGVLLSEGKLTYFDDIEEAILAHQRAMGGPKQPTPPRGPAHATPKGCTTPEIAPKRRRSNETATLMSGTDTDTNTTRRFLIIGLPRSGTTYLMTLLNSHSDVLCSGEQFNPYEIVGINAVMNDPATMIERDRAPLYFMERFFEQAAAEGYSRVGFKYMLGHNVRILSKLAEYPDIDLIYVWRENRLAQVSSLIKATQNQRWAQTRPDASIKDKIAAGPRQILQRWHEYTTVDYLFSQLVPHLPNRVLKLEYRELFAQGINTRLCDFLDVEEKPDMASDLVKQNVNTVLDRFEHPERIEAYFRQLGFERWLGREL